MFLTFHSVGCRMSPHGGALLLNWSDVMCWPHQILIRKNLCFNHVRSSDVLYFPTLKTALVLPNMSGLIQFKQRMTLWKFLVFKCSTVPCKEPLYIWNKWFCVRKKSLVVPTKNAEWTSDAAGCTLGQVRTPMTPKSSKFPAFVSFLENWLLSLSYLGFFFFFF